MPVTTLRSLIAAAALLATTAAILPAQAAGASGEVLTNETVIQMFTAKVPKGLIVTKVQSTKSSFDITPTGLLQLSTAKVPNDVIKQMMTVAGDTKKETLDNDAVIKMVAGGLSRDLIILKIQMSKPNYDLTASGLIKLNQNKVAQETIKVMMAATSGTPAGH